MSVNLQTHTLRYISLCAGFKTKTGAYSLQLAISLYWPLGSLLVSTWLSFLAVWASRGWLHSLVAGGPFPVIQNRNPPVPVLIHLQDGPLQVEFLGVHLERFNRLCPLIPVRSDLSNCSLVLEGPLKEFCCEHWISQTCLDQEFWENPRIRVLMMMRDVLQLCLLLLLCFHLFVSFCLFSLF